MKGQTDAVCDYWRNEALKLRRQVAEMAEFMESLTADDVDGGEIVRPWQTDARALLDRLAELQAEDPADHHGAISFWF